jgi:isoquinoline 1-oxidoreductase alpha subunit
LAYDTAMPSLTVNGHPLAFHMDPQTPLLWALREAANLTGTKYGCGSGDCRACLVLVDGQGVPSCQMSLAEAEGRNVTTIEGLSHDRSHPVQQAMVAEGAIQCGFCTPGLVLAGAALLAANADPTDADIKAAITGLCRCGVYPRLLRAIHRAARVMRGQERIAAAPPPGVSQGDAARAVPALRGDGGSR